MLAPLESSSQCVSLNLTSLTQDIHHKTLGRRDGESGGVSRDGRRFGPLGTTEVLGGLLAGFFERQHVEAHGPAWVGIQPFTAGAASGGRRDYYLPRVPLQSQVHS